MVRVHMASQRGQARAPSGAEVTWRAEVDMYYIYYIYMFNKYIGLPCIGRQIINTL